MSSLPKAHLFIFRKRSYVDKDLSLVYASKMLHKEKQNSEPFTQQELYVGMLRYSEYYKFLNTQRGGKAMGCTKDEIWEKIRAEMAEVSQIERPVSKIKLKLDSIRNGVKSRGQFCFVFP
jgi:hypothetical protein